MTAQTDVQISAEVRMSLLGSVNEVTASIDKISLDFSTVERDLTRILEKRNEFMIGVREY